jgi:hypothetical protein
VKYEERYGGIILDSNVPPQTLTPIRGVMTRDNEREENPFAFHPSNANTCSPGKKDILQSYRNLTYASLVFN